jgi:hypothetical protein
MESFKNLDCLSSNAESTAKMRLNCGKLACAVVNRTKKGGGFREIEITRLESTNGR